ncbi:MAG: phosphotransferase [Nitrospirae bacterium]|nr:phosphotransferase [Candidatus Manganitrophaceae bacterium]
MLREIEKVIIENGPRWEVPFFPPRNLFFTKTGGSKRNPTAQPVVFLLFDEAGSAPRWVAKVSRDRSTVDLLQREYENLLYFYHRLSPTLRATIPKPLVSQEDPGRFLFIEGGLKGNGLPAFVHPEGGSAHRKEINAMLEQAIAWLIQFQKETREESLQLSEKWIKEEAQKSVDLYRSTYQPDPLEETFLQEHLKRWEEWIGTEIPLTGQHGDFWLGNMLSDGNSISLCDWSFSKKKEIPSDDLFFFLCALPVGAEAADPLRSFENLFFKDHWFRQRAEETVTRFFAEWKLPLRLFNQLFPYFLIKMSIREAGQYQLHALRNHIWRDRVVSLIQNRSRLINVGAGPA